MKEDKLQTGPPIVAVVVADMTAGRVGEEEEAGCVGMTVAAVADTDLHMFSHM